MIEQSLFNPKRLELPGHLVLIPQFWEKEYYQDLKKKAAGCLNLLHSDLLLFEDYSLLVGFLGYPHILTILEFIQDVRQKEIYFLGTAGSLQPTINQPLALEVEMIYSSAILEHFSPEPVFPLKTFPANNNHGLRRACGVTVDIIQRETIPWLKTQVQRGIDFVEMELFPLRVYLNKSFHAIVITSDLLEETGIQVFPDKKRLQQQFIKAYQLIENAISATKQITIKKNNDYPG